MPKEDVNLCLFVIANLLKAWISNLFQKLEEAFSPLHLPAPKRSLGVCQFRTCSWEANLNCWNCPNFENSPVETLTYPQERRRANYLLPLAKNPDLFCTEILSNLIQCQHLNCKLSRIVLVPTQESANFCCQIWSKSTFELQII